MDIAAFSAYQFALERIRLVDATKALLLARGVQAVQVGDVAIALRIPVAAVERQFPAGMPALAQATLEAHLRDIHTRLLAQRPDCGNAVEELLAMRQLLLQQLNDTQRLFLQELTSCYPLLGRYQRRSRFVFMFHYLRQNLQRGVREGYYRADLSGRDFLISWLHQVGSVEQAATSTDALQATYDALFTQLLDCVATPLGTFVLHRLRETPPYY